MFRDMRVDGGGVIGPQIAGRRKSHGARILAWMLWEVAPEFGDVASVVSSEWRRWTDRLL